jgi:biotin carboxyl carrier protein
MPAVLDHWMIHRFSVEVGGQEREITLEPLEGGRFAVGHDGRRRIVEARKVAGNERASTWSILPEGGGAAAQVDVDGSAPDLTVTLDNVTVPIKLMDARRKLAAVTRPQASGPISVKSPMPGKIVKLLVKKGDDVKAGQGVAVVEAMKMENELKAPRDGKVVSVAAQEGAAVEAGQTLVTIE